jgi:hypothetical protein
MVDELSVIGKLKHPNIVTLHGACYHADGSISIVEELAEGDAVSLYNHPGSRGLPVETCFKFGLDIARGVAFMHANSIAHLDLKPDNVLICNGTGVVADFGLSRAFSSVAFRPPTKGSSAWGTLPYMAPENYSPSDPNYRCSASDVYSIGCILFEFATAKYPFQDRSVSQHWDTMQYLDVVVKKKERPPLDGVRHDLACVIRDCWKHKPADRPTASALVDRLFALHTGTPPPVIGGFDKLSKFVATARKHGIRPEWLPALRNLEAFDIVFICDDSGSMLLDVDVDGTTMKRWDELRRSVEMVADIASALDDDGCDVYFLNRPPVKQVKAADVGTRLPTALTPEPSGGTPLNRVLRQAVHDKGFDFADEPKRALRPAKRLLLLIATDGQPDLDDGGIDGFVDSLQALPEKVHVQLMAVTDDRMVLDWMKEADDKVRFLDVCDDFTSERKEVVKAQGAAFRFTHADYLTKILLGAIDPYFDLLDETAIPPSLGPLPFPAFRPMNRSRYRSSGGGSVEPSFGGSAPGDEPIDPPTGVSPRQGGKTCEVV